MGFHVDGFARDLVNMPARLVIPMPAGVSFRDAACAPVAFATVQHMLFDNAKLEPGETILVQAGGSGIGTAAIKMAKAIGCTVITTVGDDEKAAKAKALGADHVINYRTERFEGVVRKLTAKKGVDVAFEHVGPDTFNGSLFCLKRGGRLVTCGSTSGQSTTINLFQLYLQQYRIFGSFGASMRNIRESLAKMASGLAAGDRHRGRARRLRARPRAARKPAGVRQDHRHVLSAIALMAAPRSSFSTRASARSRSDYCARSSAWIASARRTSPARCMRKLGPLLPGAPRRPRQSARRLSGKIRRRDRTNSRRRLGQSRPDRCRVRASRRILHRRRRPRKRPNVITYTPETAERYRRIATAAKPMLSFAAHLANWELPAVAAKLLGATFRRPLSATEYPRRSAMSSSSFARR